MLAATARCGNLTVAPLAQICQLQSVAVKAAPRNGLLAPWKRIAGDKDGEGEQEEKAA